MSVLKYGSYTFTPTPQVRVESRSLSRAESPRGGDEIRWIIDGEFFGDGTALISKLAALEAALTDGQAAVLWKDGEAEKLMELPTTGVLVTGQPYVVAKPAFPVGGGIEFATLRRYHVELAASYKRGSGTNAVGYYTKERSTDAQGVTTITLAGEYTGSGALTAANAAKLSSDVRVLSERQTYDYGDDAHTQYLKVNFTYQYQDLTAGFREVILMRETISLRPKRTKRVVTPTLGGGFKYQDTVDEPAVGVQEGEAVGVTTYPSAPADAWSSGTYLDMIDEGTTKTSPDKTLTAGQYRNYAIRWRRQFIFATTPAFPTPAV